MVSMMDILSGAAPLIVDVRQTGAGPSNGLAGIANVDHPWPRAAIARTERRRFGWRAQEIGM
jgi:hypothetical protein